MSNKIIKLTQAEASVIDNLEAGDQKMLDLNNKLVGLLDEYEKLNFSSNTESFFSLQNIYFWILLLGLVLLAIGLTLLLVEIKKTQKRNQPEMVKQIMIEEKEALALDENQEIEKEEIKSSKTEKTKRKPIKIKVVKVK